MIDIEDDFTFNVNDRIVVGCSGGPDSMALVDMLLKVREKYKLFLVIAYVNHNIRRESAFEEDFLKKYCGERGLLFESMIIENYGDDNFHNEARNIRYSFFEGIVAKYECKYLMTAHHGDDLIETIMMRIVRGSNLKGYGGFSKYVDMDNYTIVRPLLNYTKEQLVTYDNDNDVKYCTDDSNNSDKYTRNRYRKYVLPFLKSEDENVHYKFIKFSNVLYDASVFIDKFRKKALERIMNDGKMNIDGFLSEDQYIQREILYCLLSDFYQDDLILLNDKHIDLILQVINSKKSNVSINLPNDVVARKSYNSFELIRETNVISSYEIELDNYVLLPNNHYIEKIDYSNDYSNNVCRLNSSDLSMPLIVRTRKFGDRIVVKGLGGSRKIKDIFIDKKIPLDCRDSWPIVVDSIGRIVWIPGIKKSKFDKKGSDVYDIILKYG